MAKPVPLSPLIAEMLTVFEAYCAGRGVSEARGSTAIFGSGHRILKIRAGRDMGIIRYVRALQRMSDDWPEAGVWPAHIARPAQKAPPTERRVRRTA